MNALPGDENILNEIRVAIQKLSVRLTSAEEQYDLNKRVQLKIEREPKFSKLICKIDGRLGNEVTKTLLNTITQVAAKNKIIVSKCE